MGIVGRYKLWAAIREARESKEALDVAAGRDAEVDLRAQIGRSIQFEGTEVFAGRRIPSRRQDRRREIDLIVCGPRRIHLIEIKNWSGQLELHGRDWIQERRGGGTVNHRDLLAENLLKREATHEFLREQGLEIDDAFATRYFVPMIMFMNSKLEMDPRIEALPEVFSRRELDRYLDGLSQGRPTEGFFAYCFAKARGAGTESLPPPIEPKLYARIAKSLSETATWDQIGFHGTKTTTGDLISLKLGAQIHRRAAVVEQSEGRALILKWTRNPILGWLKVLTGIGALGRIRLGKRWVRLEGNESVFFQEAGERESKRLSLVGVETLILG